MPKVSDYYCEDCQQTYEFMHHPVDEPAVCPACGSKAATAVPGGRLLGVIVPTYPGCKRVKAGYVHTHGDRPAEKISVSVPRAKGD